MVSQAAWVLETELRASGKAGSTSALNHGAISSSAHQVLLKIKHSWTFFYSFNKVCLAMTGLELAA